MKTPRQEIQRFCQSHGLKVNGDHGIPMLSNVNDSWIECFDTWKAAWRFLVSARRAYIDQGKPYPWVKTKA